MKIFLSLFALCVLFFAGATTAFGAKTHPSRNKDFLRRLVERQQRQNQTKNQQQKPLSSLRQQENLVGASRPTSTIPFITDRTKLKIYARDTNNYKFGSSTKVLDIPTRYMWGWGGGVSGYCGETCFQAALIYNGAWVSAERVRYADGNEELLIGVNDEQAASNLALTYETYSSFKATGQDYLDDWVKPKIDAGSPVVLGFYIYEKGGDAEYDHIMEIVGYELDAAGSGVVGIYFNDWYTSEVRYLGKLTASGSTNARWISSRKTCNTQSSTSNPYDYCIPSSYQYSIALTGLNVANTNTIYTRVIDYLWKEPDWGAEDGLHQSPVQMNFTLVINGNLQSNADYTVLRFDSPAALKDGSTPQTSSFSWRYDFQYTGAANGKAVLTNVTTLMSDGEYYWVTVPKF